MFKGFTLITKKKHLWGVWKRKLPPLLLITGKTFRSCKFSAGMCRPFLACRAPRTFSLGRPWCVRTALEVIELIHTSLARICVKQVSLVTMNHVLFSVSVTLIHLKSEHHIYSLISDCNKIKSGIFHSLCCWSTSRPWVTPTLLLQLDRC